MALVTPGSGKLYDAIRAIYGKNVSDSLLALALENPDEGLRITFIVNGRIIQSRAIAKAIDNAYKSMVPKSGYPMAVLCLDVPPRTVDVNVHPQKSEMKFEDESLIFKAVYKATLDAVRPAQDLGLQRVAAVVDRPSVQMTQEPMHFVPATAPAPRPVSNPGYAPRTPYEAVHQAGGFAGTGTFGAPAGGFVPQGSGAVSFAEAQKEIAASRATHYPVYGETAQNVAESGQGIVANDVSNADVAQDDATAIAVENAMLSEGAVIPIGQVDRTYIIAQDAKGLYIVDQHAAHERILFDKFSAEADGIPSQQLLVHQMLTFDDSDATLIEEHTDLFAHLGFRMEAAGPRDYRLTEVPADIPVAEAEDIIREILTNLHDLHAASAAELRKHALATTACRAAIKAGEELNFQQMQIILDELSRTAYPFTCPHGRPTILKFSTDDLAKMFKRTGFDLKK